MWCQIETPNWSSVPNPCGGYLGHQKVSVKVLEGFFCKRHMPLEFHWLILKHSLFGISQREYLHSAYM